MQYPAGSNVTLSQAVALQTQILRSSHADHAVDVIPPLRHISYVTVGSRQLNVASLHSRSARTKPHAKRLWKQGLGAALLDPGARLDVPARPLQHALVAGFGAWHV